MGERDLRRLSVMASIFAIEAIPQLPDFHNLPRWKVEQDMQPTNPRKAKKRAKIKAARKQKHVRKA